VAVHTTQVGIVGAGPAGLLLGHLLHLNGIDSVVLENRPRDYVIDRVRAGVLEQGTVDLLMAMGVGAGVESRGLRHDGLYISFQGRRHRIDMAELTGGRAITVYGQNEVVRDLIDARVATARPLYFEAEDVSVAGLDTTPVIRYRHAGADHELRCDFIAGCDGFHGICRPSIPNGDLTIYERSYPFGWLGILAEVEPSSEELVYTYHERGFALFSMRSPTVTRLYFQVPPDESIDKWTDDAIWDLRTPALERRSLPHALREVGARAVADRPVSFDVCVKGAPQSCSPAVEQQLLLICQEALTNAVRHGSPRRIDVELEYGPKQVSVRVSDDGRGFDPARAEQATGHYGVVSMRERAAQVRGRLTIASKPGNGTRVEAVVPVV